MKNSLLCTRYFYSSGHAGVREKVTRHIIVVFPYISDDDLPPKSEDPTMRLHYFT